MRVDSWYSPSGVLSLQFTQEPGNHVAVATQPTWWHCSAHSDQPVTYSWSRGSQPVNGQPNYDVLANGTLRIISVSQSDVGSYTCQARTSRGEIITSREALLTLASKFQDVFCWICSLLQLVAESLCTKLHFS